MQHSRLSNSLFRNLGNGTFADSAAESGIGAGPPGAHRGAAFADFDGDGRVDVAVSALNDPAELWRNESPGTSHWVDIRLVGKRSNRDGIGALVEISAAADARWRKQWNHMTTAVGYASSSNTGIHFGTGTAAVIDRLEIRWPSGTVQTLTNVPRDSAIVVEEP